jgi:hypothetical protein
LEEIKYFGSTENMGENINLEIDQNNITECIKKGRLKKAIDTADGKTFSLKIDYALTTNFTRLEPQLKKQAKILRILVTEEPRLFEIIQ